MKENFGKADRAVKGGKRVTKQQKKAVRKALRQYGHEHEPAAADSSETARWRRDWAKVISQAMDYYAVADPVCAELLRMRYLQGKSEWEVIGALHIGRTTYYRKELEALSTVGIYAAGAGLI